MTDKPAKKTAAAPRKTAESKEDSKVPVYAFPAPASHYFSVATTSQRSMSSGPYVAAIQRALGQKETGVFDTQLRVKVMEWQDQKDRPITGVVNSDDWDVLFNDV